MAAPAWRRRAVFVYAAAAAAVVALPACGSQAGQPSGQTQAPQTDGASPSGQATTPSGTPAPAGPALASRQGQVDGQAVLLEIAELKHSGQTATLAVRLTTTVDDRAQVAGTFGNGEFEEISGANSIAGGNTLDGISLIDTRNAKKHLVARDASGQCVCDVDLGSAFVDSDAPLVLSATFAAPPAGVDRMDVFVPKFGTFKDVPVG